MHRDPTPHDRPPLDSDSIGYDPREHEHGQHAVTKDEGWTALCDAIIPRRDDRRDADRHHARPL